MLQKHNPQDARVRWGDTVVEFEFPEEYRTTPWAYIFLGLGTIVVVAMFVVAAFI